MASIVALCLAVAVSVSAEETTGHAGHHHQHTSSAPGGDPHAGHKAVMKEAGSGYTKVSAGYKVPGVTLRDQNNAPVDLKTLLAEDRPVLLQFIFTTCTTICPLLSASLSMAQPEIGKLAANYRMVSISIDPEHDTPARLREYASRNGAMPNWLFLTGTNQDVRKVIKAFGAYYQGDNKMYHQPYTYLRAKAGAAWVRLAGFPSDAELVKEFRKVVSLAAAHHGHLNPRRVR